MCIYLEEDQETNDISFTYFNPEIETNLRYYLLALIQIRRHFSRIQSHI